MVEQVETSLEELRQGMAGHDVRVQEDGDGGAYVIVDDIEIGDHFAPPRSWIGFHVTFAEDADVYPHFIDPGLLYIGPLESAPIEHPEGNLPTAMSRGQQMPGFNLAAIQVSRRSNHRNGDTDSPLMKLLRLIDFLQTR
jgi:hypothetical protein